jgi:predicted metalloprotease with PDZ domain
MKVLLFICCCLAAFTVRSQIAAESRVDAKMSFVPTGKKVDVKVTVAFPVVSDEPFLIGNLRDYYGYARLGNFMTSLEGKNGTTVLRNLSDSILITPSGKKVAFSYTLSYDSSSFSEHTYAPNVGVDHVHFAFCQWMLPLAERNVILDYRISIEHLPKSWLLYSSASPTPQNFAIKTSLYESFSMVIGAGRLYKYSYRLKGKPLNVYIKGNFTAGNKRLSDLAYKTVNYQHGLFNDFQFPFYEVVLLPKEGNVAGLSIPNMFLCHIKKDVDFQKLAWLMSHEMLHRWVGNTVSLTDTTRFKLRHQWFKEGINDYLAYLVLLDSRSYTRDEFVDGINEYLRNILENPYGDASEDSINRVVLLGKYGTAATKLPYYKGGMIGFLSDIHYLESSKTEWRSHVKAFMLELLRQPAVDGRIAVRENKFFEIADSMKLPLRSLYEKHVLEGSAEFDLPKMIFDGAYKLEKTEYQIYDAGLSFTEKDDKLFTTAVKPSGPAYRAGIRNDMEVVSTTIVNRFSYAWCDCPVKVVVTENGKDKTYTYLPRGRTAEIYQYVLNIK